MKKKKKKEARKEKDNVDSDFRFGRFYFICEVVVFFCFLHKKKDNAHQQNKRENTSFWIRFVILFEWCSNRHARQPR
jgi:hypothetical protein